ncbi:glycosyltransferase family 4 protein, partial [Escherichia coli]|uniref:hypothetical protein n=1 Tax=Escherichia coli TaxID=562 RepID=UPI001BE4B65F
PLPLVESAISLDPLGSTFAAVSAFTAAAWAHAVPATVIPNGIDLSRWYAGAAGGPAVWSGRLVPEKAPHAAMDACRRAGVPLVLVGPAHDEDYYRSEVEPRLGDGIEYAGHLTHAALGRLLRRASAAVVTPAW